MSRETDNSIIVKDGQLVLLKVGKGDNTFARVHWTPLQEDKVLVGIHPIIEDADGASLIGTRVDDSHVKLTGCNKNEKTEADMFFISNPNFFQVCLYKLGMRMLSG